MALEACSNIIISIALVKMDFQLTLRQSIITVDYE